jgi:hypothetical protein
VDLGTEENAQLAKLLGWHVVTCAGPVETPANADQLLAAALAQHQRHAVNPELPPFRIALETVRGWLTRSFEYVAPGLRGVLRAVAPPDATPAGEGRRLVGLIRQLIRAGEMTVQTAPGQLSDLLPSKSHAVRQGDAVCVPVEGFLRALKGARLPYQPGHDADACLAAAGVLHNVVSSLGSVVGWRIKAEAL